MTDVVTIILWGIIEVLLVVTGKFVVSALSLGRWRAQEPRSNEERMYGPAGALSFRHDGQRVVTYNGQLFAGLLFYVALAWALFAVGDFLR